MKIIISKNKLFNILNDIFKQKSKKCPICSVCYNKKHDLKKHIILECINIDFQIKDDAIIINNEADSTILPDETVQNISTNGNKYIENNIINNGTLTNNNNYIDKIDVTNNYHINSPVSFDEEWDVSHLSDEEKTVLIISMYKYTKTLESLLKNKNNHNVIIDKGSNSGLVYKKNNIETMSLNEICDKSVDKLYHHLNKFVDDVIKNNNTCVEQDYIMHSKKVIRIKHGNYKYNKKDRISVNNILVEKFDNIKNETLEKFNEINQNKIKF